MKFSHCRDCENNGVKVFGKACGVQTCPHREDCNGENYYEKKAPKFENPVIREYDMWWELPLLVGGMTVALVSALAWMSLYILVESVNCHFCEGFRDKKR